MVSHTDDNEQTATGTRQRPDGTDASAAGSAAPPGPASGSGPDGAVVQDAPRESRPRRRRSGLRRRKTAEAEAATAAQSIAEPDGEQAAMAVTVTDAPASIPAQGRQGPAIAAADAERRPPTDAAPSADPASPAAVGAESASGEGADGEGTERKRRRGRRGGKRHKKADTVASDAEAISTDEAAAGAPPAPSTGPAAPDNAARSGAGSPVIDGRDVAAGAAAASEPAGQTDAGAGDGQEAAKTTRRRRGRRGGARRSRGAASTAEPEAQPAAPKVSPAEAEPPQTTAAPGSATPPEPVAEPERVSQQDGMKRRRRRKKTEPDAVATSPPERHDALAAEESEAAPEQVPAVPLPEAEADDEPAASKRRRGRRKRSEAVSSEPAEADAEATAGAADAAVDASETIAGDTVAAHAGPRSAAEGALSEADAKADRRAEERDTKQGSAWASSRRRRRQAGAPPREKKDRVILATESADELRVAVVEDDRLAEVYLQRAERPSILGNIYQARVQNVLRGMDAAFVDFGLEKSGFLHVDEVEVADGGPRRGRRITQLLQPGQEILVQITKDPMKGKGARLTTRVTLAGRYVVYVPGGEGVGVSRRLSQEERDRLRDACKSLRVRKAGLIVRTVAEGKGVEELRRDVQYLSRQWSRIKAKAEKKTAPALIHEEVDVTLEAARDLFDDAYRAYIVDSSKVHKRLVAYLQRVAPELAPKIELYSGEQPLFEKYGVEEGIEATLARRVPLPSGGNLVIDHTEALTVIDVNSGRYTGGSGLEETITHTNLDAAAEVVRQLRLRDIGGIIVIDFIDMAKRENRAAVLARLEHELALDRTKSYVVEISPLGLVEMTRQSTTEGTRGLLTTVCPMCHTTGRVLSPDTMSRDVVRTLRRQLPQIKGQAVLIEVQRAVADRLERSERVRRLERESGRRLYFEGSAALPVDTLNIVASGSVAEVEAQRLPVQEGEELDVEIRHSLPFSPDDGVAVIGGYQLVVKGGRRFVGSVQRVRVEIAQRHGGIAVNAGNGRKRRTN